MLSPETLVQLCAAKERLRHAPPRELSIATLARTARMSPWHFIRRFAAVFGETPHQYRLRSRLERARELLAAGEQSVTDVCLDVGFGSVASFSAAFARRFGAAPSVYRRRARAPGRGSAPAQLAPDCLALMNAAAQFSRSNSPQSWQTGAPLPDSARPACASSSTASSSTTKTKHSASTRRRSAS